jgi:hypothetical protein
MYTERRGDYWLARVIAVIRPGWAEPVQEREEILSSR